MNCIFDKKTIIKLFNENKNSHAFLINSNNINSALEDILDLIKKINCKTGKDNCNCNSCNLINSNNSPDLMIIRPDGKEIKKDAVENLMKLFSTTTLVSKYSTYIIVGADLMNSSAANKILKFLEEPEPNIIGFFITDKEFNIMETIKSRCQIYDSFYIINNFFDYFDINQEDFDNYFDSSMEILKLLNTNKKYIIINSMRKVAKKERNDLIKIFDLVNKMYILKYEYLTGNKFDFNYSYQIITNIKENDLNIILTRIKLLNDLVDKIRYNVNKELVINKTFLEWL